MKKSTKRLTALLLGMSLAFGQAGLTAINVSAQENEKEPANSFRYKDGEPIKQPSDMLRSSAVKDDSYYKSLVTYAGTARKKGMDVSYYQGDINWSRIKKDKDINFAILRCGYIGPKSGKVTDSKWHEYAKGCTAQKIPFGAYIYSYALNKEMAIKEANHVLSLVKNYNLQYPIYLDMEDSSMAKLKNKELKEIAQAFCETIESAGYEAAIYANYNWFTTKLTDSYFNLKDRWIARYNSFLGFNDSFNMWQYTSEGKVNGIDGNVDLNWQYGSKPPAEVKKVKLSSSSGSMYIGDSKKLTASVLPKNAYDKKIQWTSSNNKVATVSGSGTIKAVGCGSAQITAQVKGYSAKAVFKVEVKGLLIEQKKSVIDKGQTIKLTAKHYSTKKEVTASQWESSNSKVAVVNKNGIVKAVGYGTARITAKYGSLIGACNTTVRVPVSSVKLNKSSVTVSTGACAALKATVAPSNATYKTVSYKSSSPSVAKVSSSGKITGVNPGRTTITAAAENKKAVCTVYVAPARPGSFTYSQPGASKLRLSWKTVKGTDGYVIYRYDSKTKKNLPIHTSKATTKAYNLTRQNGSKGQNFTVGSSITYRIASYKKIGSKRYYGPMSSLTAVIKPAKTSVTGLKKVSAGKARVTWKKIGGVSGYVVYYSASRSGGYRKAATVSGSKNTYTKSGLRKGKTYYFKICTYKKVKNKNYYSPMSNIRSVKL